VLSSGDRDPDFTLLDPSTKIPIEIVVFTIDKYSAEITLNNKRFYAGSVGAGPAKKHNVNVS